MMASAERVPARTGLLDRRRVSASPARHHVYEVTLGEPTWSRLLRLTSEHVADLVTAAVIKSVARHGRTGCQADLVALRRHLVAEMPASLISEVLNICLARDRLRCHHNPTDCLALELWRVFYTDKLPDVYVIHHAFAFPKTSNYPEIVQSLEQLLTLISTSSRSDAAAEADKVPDFSPAELPATAPTAPSGTSITTMSFKLELKQCEIGFLLEDRVVGCLVHLGAHLRTLELPGLCTDRLLYVIAAHCTNLEMLNLRGSREQVSDVGFANFVALARCKTGLRQLDVSRCSLFHRSLASLPSLSALHELRLSTAMVEDVQCDSPSTGGSESPESPLPVQPLLLSVQVITVESDSCVPVSISKVMSFLREAFPCAKDIQLVNCIACELHVTLTQQPTNLTYMRETIHTLELISADYFNFPRLVYPCPNLESLCIEKPTNDVFNIDQQNVPFLYGNTIPFINLKHLKLSRISLTNLMHFLSKSKSLRKFKVTNIGRRERPRWTDQRIQQILPADSVPFLEDFHVSCLPNEGYSTSDSHRYLHLTSATIQYLTENFKYLRSIAGIESWIPTDCNNVLVSKLLNANTTNGRKFSVTSL